MSKNVLEPYIKEMISERVEQLTWEGEHLPESVRSRAEMSMLRAKAEHCLGKDETENLISAVHGCDIPIYEHCYLAGLIDGLKMISILEKMSK